LWHKNLSAFRYNTKKQTSEFFGFEIFIWHSFYVICVIRLTIYPMKINHYYLQATFILLVALAAGCTPSRGIIASGKVTTKGAIKAGYNASFNISSSSLSEVDNIAESAVNALQNRDSIYYDADFQSLTRSLLAYSLDPTAPTSDFYIRYGVADRVDVGYKYASGAHVLDAMYQFLGSTGTIDNPGPAGLYGSIGLQYSGQNSNLPSRLGLSALSSILNYDLKRKDILVPLVFSKSFGQEEEYGNFSWGVVYGHTFINYGFEPGNLYEKLGGTQTRQIKALQKKENFSSFGTFINAKIGYRYIYFLPALSIYYQNYGTYDIFGLQQENYKGFTFIPSLGFQINFSTISGNTRSRRR